MARAFRTAETPGHGAEAMTFHKSFMTLATLACLFAIFGCSGPEPGTVPDEAMRAGRPASSFPAADEDYFADMDGGYKRNTDPSVTLDADEVRGRNTWTMWTGVRSLDAGSRRNAEMQ